MGRLIDGLVFFILMNNHLNMYGGVSSSCAPCECVDNMLLCFGSHIRYFPPAMNNATKHQLHTITIRFTDMPALPPVHIDDYPVLTLFQESSNILLRCVSIQHWHSILINTAFITGCWLPTREPSQSTAVINTTPAVTTYGLPGSTSEGELSEAPMTDESITTTIYDNYTASIESGTDTPNGEKANWIIYVVFVPSLAMIFSIILYKTWKTCIKKNCSVNVNNISVELDNITLSLDDLTGDDEEDVFV